MKDKIRLAVTMGDPAGIGPEIAAKAFADPTVFDKCLPLLVGNVEVMKEAIKLTGVDLKINPIKDVKEAKLSFGTIDIYDIPVDKSKIIHGKVTAEAGDLAFKAVRKAIELAMNGDVDGTVTGPIHKEAINLAGHHFSGHTEIYAHFTGTEKYTMLLADEKIKVTHVSTHVSLRKACDLVKKQRVFDVIRLTNDALKRIGIANPRIGVAGLNPHAGDGGLFGSEETEEILPAINEAKHLGVQVAGPYPPDTLFSLANGGSFDGCVAMYHDQGHIPFKLVGFIWDEEKQAMKSVKGVNITLGLPIIRTSVDHGTAFEIAGKGIASPDALVFAMDYAIKLYQNQ
ncbi:4-hydroxythreonine-4-phosphate dehydrogenase PdxA [Mangrovibacterium marinum]|uniref:4-hydroxythreonine-4-phosphate dehydrogenase n=1 Tax=Mangrovibacterium marinum TaxID=1639118 RepID=A0A2T5C409_9BACT|nr:4-hydroxythreonine-4-phosphate dehydrogenase PdxA [Mangrovibacterium marinum]PTN09540.1 4-hydroxythreonine-4-phosphate dehydrogenase [Mangrovibacterium marinum]